MSTELSDVAKASVRGSFFLFLGNMSSTLVVAFTSILVARLLGPEDYGLYSLALIASSFLTVLSDLGISPALSRFSARFHSRGRDQKVVGLVKAGMIFKFIFPLLLSLVLLLLSENIATWVLGRPGIGFLIRLTAFYLVGQAVFMTLNSIFIGLDKTENTALMMNIQAVTKAVSSLLLIILGMGIMGAILGAGLGFLLAAAIGVTVLLLRLYPSLNIHNGGENVDFFQGLRLMILYGMPLYLSTLILTLLSQYQSFILAQFVSNVEIGNYTIAINFSILITLLSYPIGTSLFPAFSKVSIDEDRRMVEKMFKLSVKYTSLLVIPASLAVAVFSKELVYTLYGSQFQLAPTYLALYVLTFLCTGLGMFVVPIFFNGQGDTTATLRMNLVNLGLSLPLAFITTSLCGVPGLIASLLVSQLLSVTYGLFLTRKKYAVTLDWASSLGTGVASLSSALLVYIFITFAPIPIAILKLAIGAPLYVTSFLAFAPLLKVIDKEDIKNLDEMLKGLAPVYPIARWILNLEKKILNLKYACIHDQP